MHKHTYFLTLAENAEDAKSTVESWIDDHYEREFYDYGGLEESEDEIAFPVKEVLKELEERREYTENETLPDVEKDIEKYKTPATKVCWVTLMYVMEISYRRVFVQICLILTLTIGIGASRRKFQKIRRTASGLLSG
jgi:hypothetical protein